MDEKEYGQDPMLEAEEMIKEEEGTVNEPMTEEKLQGIISSEITDAISFIDEEIGDERAKATEYYKGEPFGDEEEGRSQVVSMDVRDTIQAILPSIMRIFFGPKRVVEYTPEGPEDVANAEQATDYVDFITKRDNPGFTILYSTFKDALVRKTGVIKYWWDESVEVKAESFSGLDEDQMILLTQDPDVEIAAIREVEAGMMGQIGQMMGMMPKTYDVDIKRRVKRGRVKIEALPPEEFLIDRRAKSLDDAMFVAHRRMMTVSELVAMGYDYDLVVEQAGDQYDFDTNVEYQTRNPAAIVRGAVNDDPAGRYVLYIEGYAKVDYDGDGIAELRKICTIGSSHKIIANEVIDQRPFADFCPDPEPHTFFGMSIADVVMDIQKIKSSIMRNMLDSLAQSIHPRTTIVEGQANLDDVLNNEVGAVIRMRAPGMVMPLATPFVGKEAFPMLDYMDSVRENRTGISKAAAGLDADALQSTTKAAVAATVSAAHQHIELIARIFAETGMRRLFRGILKLIVENQDKPRMVRLRNEFVPIDPRSWDAGMDVAVNVGIGDGTIEERINVLINVAEKQELILKELGLSNDLVTLGQYRNTLAKILELAGHKDVNQFFQPMPLDYRPEPPPPRPTPEEVLAQVQAEAIKADIQKKAADLELQREKMMREDDRERDRIETDRFIKLRDLELKYNARIDEALLNMELERDREASRKASALETAMVQNMPVQNPQPPMN
jgi:hypothetical protein